MIGMRKPLLGFKLRVLHRMNLREFSHQPGFVEALHQQSRRSGACDWPEASHDARSARANKCACQTQDFVARTHIMPTRHAGAQIYQMSLQLEVRDLTRRQERVTTFKP